MSKRPIRAPRASTATALLASVAALVGGGVSLAGCGASATLDPVARAAEVSSSQPGAAFTLNVEISSSALSGPASISGHGSFDQQQRAVDMTASLAGIPGLGTGGATLRMVMVYPHMYMKAPFLSARLPGGKPWIGFDLEQAAKASGLGALSSLGQEDNPGQELQYLRASSGDVTVVGHETLDGVPTTHYHASIEVSRILARLPASQQSATRRLLSRVGSKLPVDVWVDAQSRVRRVRSAYTIGLPSGPEGGAAGGRAVTSTVTMNITRYGSVPTISAPPASEVFDATSLVSQGLARASG
jgi:hypothetical protein